MRVWQGDDDLVVQHFDVEVAQAERFRINIWRMDRRTKVLPRRIFYLVKKKDVMRVGIITVTALAGGLLLAPLTLGHAQAGTTSHGNWHNWHEHYRPNSSVCGNPRFEF